MSSSLVGTFASIGFAIGAHVGGWFGPVGLAVGGTAGAAVGGAAGLAATVVSATMSTEYLSCVTIILRM